MAVGVAGCFLLLDWSSLVTIPGDAKKSFVLKVHQWVRWENVPVLGRRWQVTAVEPQRSKRAVNFSTPSGPLAVVYTGLQRTLKKKL